MTQTKTKFKTTLLIAAMLSLTACGGGDTPPPPLGVTKQVITSNLKENSSFSLTFTVENNIGAIRVTDESVSSSSTPVSGTAQISGNTLTYVVSAGDATLSNGQHTVSLNISDDSRNVKVSQTISIENTSGRAKHDKLTAMKSSVTAFASLNQEKLLFDKVSQIADLVSPSYAANSNALKAKMAAELADAKKHSSLTDWVSKTDTALSGYATGAFTEVALTNSLTEINAPLNAYATKVNAVLAELLVYTKDVVPALTLDKVFLSNDGRSVSQFEGNPTLGTYSDGRWMYTKSYLFLVAITAPETIPCTVQ